MIKLEHIDTVGWDHAIRGMRNPLQSWDKSDSDWVIDGTDKGIACKYVYELGPNDLALVKKLIKAGASHRKFLRQIGIYVDITANLKWWDEFDTYLHTVKNSTSQMHSLTKRDFRPEDFSWEFNNVEVTAIMNYIIANLNKFRKRYVAEKDDAVKKAIWRDMIEIMPQSFLYTRTTYLNYEVFLTQYAMRKNHKMSEWVEYCDVLRKELPYMDEFISILEE